MTQTIERPTSSLRIMDGHKLPYHIDRVEQWRRGERLAPVTIDMALTRKCDASCSFCVHPDTPILMADGREKAIRHILEGDAVVSMNEHGQRVISRVSAVRMTHSDADVLRCSLQSGNIILTHSHPVLTPRGWVRAGDLKVGDYVANVRGGTQAHLRADASEQPHEESSHGKAPRANESLSEWREAIRDYTATGFIRRVPKEDASLIGRAANSQRAYEGEQSHEAPCGCSPSDSHKYGERQLSPSGATHENGMGYWEILPTPIEARPKQAGATLDDIAGTFGVPVYRQRHVLDSGDKERSFKKPRLHLEERRSESSIASSRNLVAYETREHVGSRDRRLYGEGLEAVYSMDGEAAAISDSHLTDGDRGMVRWDTVTAIEAWGCSPVYDLECTPHHNFIAAGIVVANCYAMIQENERHELTWPVLSDFLDDAAQIGVRAISLLSDGESLLSRHWVPFVQKCKALGMDVAAGSNCHTLTPDRQEEALPSLSYLRINCPAGTEKRYCEIMGVPPKFFQTVLANIRNMVAIKKRDSLPVQLVLQMVCLPQDVDQVIPFVQLGKELGVEACTVKHVADDENGSLGMDYSKVKEMIPVLQEAQKLATPDYQVIVMWNKILEGMRRPYMRCRGPRFMLQISGTGLVAPCGDKFNDAYGKFHIGNIAEQRFRDIFQSERYWEVMDYLASEEFNAQKSCGPLCRQDMVNRALDREVAQGERIMPATEPVPNKSFI